MITRTTARGALALLSALFLAAFAVAAASAGVDPNGPTPEQVAAAHEERAGVATEAAADGIVFPLIGKVSYRDDFGDPRGNGAHQGNDLVTPRRTPVVAAEAGRVHWWRSSARAGCMLYLYGRSGTTYLYIHLNNDRTLRNDNDAGCELGSTYTTRDNAVVETGELIAWSGDSGDADGNPHLHFEVHPEDGDAVSPYSFLQGATHHLFPARIGKAAAVGLRGTATAAGGGELSLEVRSVRWWPGGRWTPVEARSVTVAVPAEAEIDDALAAAISGESAAPLDAAVTVVTRSERATPEQLRGASGALTAARVRAG